MSKMKPGGSLPQKSFYPLEEAAILVGCKAVGDLVHYAGQSRISMLIGVPDGVALKVYDESTRELSEPFVLTPQLLCLSSSHCLKIELQGKTQSSDFLSGYLIESDGGLKKLLPNYGRRDLNHPWIFWRLFSSDTVWLLELSPERLFVKRDDLLALMGEGNEPSAPPPSTRTAKKIRQTAGDHADAQAADFGGGHAKNAVGQVDVIESASVAAERTKSATAAVKKSDEPVEGAPKPNLKGPVILRLKQVMARTGLSRSTIYDRMAPSSPRHDGAFPKQVNLGGAVGWEEAAIDAWLQNRIAANH